MDPQPFKTPSRTMAAAITLVLLALFAMSYIAPYMKFAWLNSEVKPDPALQQNLLMLLAISVAYYIGSSKGSAESNDAIRSTLAATVTPPALATVATPPEPLVKVTTEAGP